jgi:hypothetical protein
MKDEMKARNCKLLFKTNETLNGKTMIKKVFGFFALIVAAGCNANSSEKNSKDTTTNIYRSQMIEPLRVNVQTNPVALYDFPMKDDLNHWHFTVKLFETKERFRYLLDLQYQEMTASDTITFPNFGVEPEPQLKKGSADTECILGFIDKSKNFREYIKVFVDNDRLRIKQLKQYAVYAK